MKDTSFQRGFWEAPAFWESFVTPWGVQRCSWLPLGNLLASLGSLPGRPWDVFGERPGCVFLYLVAIACIFVRRSLRALAKSCFLITFVRDRCFCSIQKKPRFPFHASEVFLIFALLSRVPLKIRAHLSERVSCYVLAHFWAAFGWLL